MKNLKIFGVALVAVMFLAFCGSPSAKAVTVDGVEISDNANKYLKVVDGDYMFTNDGDDASISVKFELKSSSEDWDEVLDSYEDYIDQYIKLLKKVKDGDTSVMTEYAEMMEKATDLAEKLENAEDELSASQMSRFVKLQTKLAKAAADMY